MSHLRAPAARADRREGGRHGRPVAHTAPSLPETHLRPQLLRLAVLPPTAVALSACAAVLFTVRSTGARPSLILWAVLAGAVGVALAGIVIAAVAADRAATSVHERIGALRRTCARTEGDLRALVEGLRRGESPPARKARRQPPPTPTTSSCSRPTSRAPTTAPSPPSYRPRSSPATRAASRRSRSSSIWRGGFSLVHREISILDELENEIEDPDLLKGLFHIDHLATRIRRHAENLAVLGGAVSRRQWSNPVSMTEVLRSAIAEVEQYSRVKLVPPIDGTLRGHAVADVIHLLAELVENATVFSAPHTQVLLRVNLVTSGLAVEVEDRGLGMPLGEQNKMNALLADPDQVNVASLLQDGRIGLFVVSQIARRHGIHVRLQNNIYGGVQAVLVVPQALLGTAQGDPGVLTRAQPQEPGADRRPQARPQAVQAGPVSAPPGGVSPVPRQTPREQASRDQTPRDQTPRDQASRGAGATGRSGPAPLPVRGSHLERPNPAEAVPGIRPDDRHAVTEHAGKPPTARGGAVRGTMGKPQLPTRRAQEHIVPQLREGPAPRQDAEHVAGHDPGLMAAFQRGIGLAEAAHAESARTEAPRDRAHLDLVDTGSLPPLEMVRVDVPIVGAGRRDTAAMDSAAMDSGHMDSGHMDTAPMDAGHRGAEHMDVPDAPRVEQSHVDISHADASHMERPHTERPHTERPHMDGLHMDGAARVDGVPGAPIGAAHIAEAHTAHAPAPHEAQGARDAAPAPAPGQDFTTRHDGSAPAG